jgi:hypothetical protein
MEDSTLVYVCGIFFDNGIFKIQCVCSTTDKQGAKRSFDKKCVCAQ